MGKLRGLMLIDTQPVSALVPVIVLNICRAQRCCRFVRILDASIFGSISTRCVHFCYQLVIFDPCYSRKAISHYSLFSLCFHPYLGCL